MRKNYTYSFVKTVTGKVTVSADSDEEAEQDAREALEVTNRRKFSAAEFIPEQKSLIAEMVESTSECTLLDLDDVEPAGGEDRSDDDHENAN